MQFYWIAWRIGSARHEPLYTANEHTFEFALLLAGLRFGFANVLRDAL